jgi:hypothetical protein
MSPLVVFSSTCKGSDEGHISTKGLRSQKTVRAFKRLYPCPFTGKSSGPCPGWIIDHILPLECHGLDVVLNMQWQTVIDAKAKDKWEICGDTQHKACSGLAY